jgi:hypothetical protein
MNRKIFAPAMILALLLSMGAMTLDAGYCMPLSPAVHVYDETDVYDIGGKGVNVTMTVDKPENKAYNSTLAFTLKVLESYTAGGYSVNPNGYSVVNHGFPNCYLVEGVILDYDRARVVNAAWINWGTQVNYDEEAELFHRSYDAVISKSGGTYYGRAILPELSEGAHNLTVWLRAQLDQITTYIPFWAAFSKTIAFTINTIPPNVTLLTPEETTYKESKASLNFTVNEPFSELAYCLDGQENVTINGNTTLTGLRNGDHNVTVYATDEFGNNGASKTIIFNVEVSEPFPTTLVIASVIIVAVAGAGLLFFFKKRKKDSGDTK